MKKIKLVGLCLGLASVAAAGCGSDIDDNDALRRELGAADATGQPLAMRGATCSPAAMFAPGEISLAERDEFRLAFSADAKTAYYHVDTAEAPYQMIYETHLRHGHWTPGTPVPFNKWSDSDPFVAPDGKTMFFSSKRPLDGVEQDNTNIWTVKFEGGRWGEPLPLGRQINTAKEELYPSVSSDGTLYWASGTFTDDGDFNIYRAVRGPHGYGTPELLGDAINSTAYWEFNPWISPNGKLLFFASANRPDGKGGADIYMSANVRGRWLPAVNLGPNVNTEGPEFHPTFVPSQGRLYFVRLTGETFTSNFYSSDAGCLLE